MGKRLNIALLAASLPLATQGLAMKPAEIRLYEENDDINPFAEGKDRYYTQGMKLEWLSRPREREAHFLPGITHSDWCRLICGAEAAKSKVTAGFAIGQNMYTPADIGFPGPQPNDRPWAGFLYVSRIARISYDEPSLKAHRQDRIEVSLGVVGPASMAKQTQTLWHDIWTFQPPNGWDNQLRNEPVVQLRYETSLRWPRKDGGKADIIPRLRVNAGNALTSLEADVTGRIGWNLKGFGVGSLQAFPEPAAEQVKGPAHALSGARWLASANLFARMGIKAVAHNITLDGNTFARNDIQIERRALVPEFAAGMEFNLVGPAWVTVQMVRRGSEFLRRNGRPAPSQDFGSITVGLLFGP